MLVADLHVHTTASDGTMALAAVPSAARRAGVRVVAITDHDRPHPALDAPVDVRDGVTVIHGIEVRVEAGSGQQVDLLGYGVERTSTLDALVDRIQRNRIERGRAIVERVEDRLGIDLGLAVGEGTGRPHVARAIAEHPDAAYDYRGAFAHLIGSDGPCYVPREVPSFETGRDVLADACALVGLAHPLRYRDPAAALSLTAELDCVERWYPYGRTVDHDLVDRAIAEHDLVATGGSDAHDDVLGRAGLDREAFRGFEEACGLDLASDPRRDRT